VDDARYISKEHAPTSYWKRNRSQTWGEIRPEIEPKLHICRGSVSAAHGRHKGDVLVPSWQGFYVFSVLCCKSRMPSKGEENPLQLGKGMQ